MNNGQENQSNNEVATTQSSDSWEWLRGFLRGIGVAAQIIVGIIDVLSRALNQKK